MPEDSRPADSTAYLLSRRFGSVSITGRAQSPVFEIEPADAGRKLCADQVVLDRVLHQVGIVLRV
jgi:hypothetical protein